MQIKVKYKVVFKFNHIEPGFERCTAEAQKARTELSTRGELECKRLEESLSMFFNKGKGLSFDLFK